VEDQWSAVLDRGGSVDFFGSRMDIPLQRRFGDIDTVRRYVAAVLAGPYVLENHRLAGPVAVRERAGQAKAHYEPGSATIAIPLDTQWAARESVILHEVAHHLAGSAVPATGRRDWHGIRFRYVMCGLVASVLGEPSALLLRTGYEGAGLRVVEAILEEDRP
jgi:putative metallohydrolase (TIGR04338 family)